MTVSVRFAPSPTGHLHIGNIRTAILNWLFARKHGGNVLLRFDDTDTQRCKPEYTQAIREDMSWLGLNWDREEHQSKRTDRYDEIAQELKNSGRLYACYETPDELGRRRRRQLARGLPPIYDRAALKLDDTERAKLQSDGRKPHWRLRLANTEARSDLTPLPTIMSWNDLIRGDQTVDLGSLSDPVLIREDGSYLYTLTSVIDDIDLGITHIIRGEDHITNTGVQVDLFEAVGATPPVFGHHSLLVEPDGKALSKRLGALSINHLRELQIEPMAVAAHAALIGTSYAIEPHRDMADLIEMFDPDKISLAPGRFDLEELKGLNAKLIHQIPFDDVANRLEDMGITGGEEFWLAVRGNLATVGDAATWWTVINGDITPVIEPVIEEASFCATAGELLPPEPWDLETWTAWTRTVKEKTGRKGRALFHPLRLALTGQEKGPELKTLLPLIGHDKASARLSGNSG